MTATPFNQKTIDEFHAKQGRGVGPWGDNLLLMTSKGAVSADDITTPLVSRRKGEDLVVVASKGGAPDHPRWLTSVELNPIVDVEVPSGDGTIHQKRRARIVAGGTERDQLYAYMVEVWPAFADYETKTDRKIAVVVLEPAGEAGA